MSIYQHYIDKTSYYDISRAIVWNVKEDLVSSGWTVFGSGTGNSGTYASSDTWTTADGANLNYGAYCILNDPSGNTQLQIGLYNDATYGQRRISWSFSQDKSFATPAAADDFSATNRIVSAPKDSSDTFGQNFDISTTVKPYSLKVWTVESGSGNEDNVLWMISPVDTRAPSGQAGFYYLEGSYTSDSNPYVIGSKSVTGSYNVMQNAKSAYNPVYSDNLAIAPQVVTASQIEAVGLWWTPYGVGNGSIWAPSYAKYGDNVTKTWPEESIQIITYDSSEYRHRGSLPNKLLRYVSDDTWVNWTQTKSGSRIIVGGFSLPWQSGLEALLMSLKAYP